MVLIVWKFLGSEVLLLLRPCSDCSPHYEIINFTLLNDGEPGWVHYRHIVFLQFSFVAHMVSTYLLHEI